MHKKYGCCEIFAAAFIISVLLISCGSFRKVSAYGQRRLPVLAAYQTDGSAPFSPLFADNSRIYALWSSCCLSQSIGSAIWFPLSYERYFIIMCYIFYYSITFNLSLSMPILYKFFAKRLHHFRYCCTRKNLLKISRFLYAHFSGSYCVIVPS